MKFSKRAGGILGSSTLAVKEKAEKMKRVGKEIFDLGAGEPDFDTPENVKRAGINAIETGFTNYTAGTGIPELKEAIRDYYNSRYGTEFSISQIMASTGGKAALKYFFVVFLDDNDEVLIPKPYWVSYGPQVEMCGGKPVYVDTQEHTYRLKASLIKKAANSKTQAIVLNSPCNPSGAMIERKELEKIVELAMSKNILILYDECYEKFVYEGEHVSAVEYFDDVPENIVVVNSFSKTYSMTGWRLGYALGSKRNIEQMGRIQGQSSSNPCSISQKAGIEALRGPQEVVSHHLKEYRKRREYVLDRLDNIPDLEYPQPEGAFYALPRVDNYYENGNVENSTEFASKLIEKEGVAVVPGEAFGVDECIRISFAASIETIERGIDGLEKFLKSLRS